MSTLTAKFRRLSQFRLRTILIVVTIFCLVLGLYVKRAFDEQQAAAAVRDWGGTAILDYQDQSALNPNLVLASRPNGRRPFKGASPALKPPNFRWLREKLGDHYFSSVVAVSVPYHATSDVNGATLLAFRKLRTLTLSGTHIDDRDLILVSSLHNLELLHLNDTDVSDIGIASLSGLPQLTNLSLCGTSLSDIGLSQLAKLPRLEQIDVRDTLVTQQGLARFRSDRPTCQVTADRYTPRSSLLWKAP